MIQTSSFTFTFKIIRLYSKIKSYFHFAAKNPTSLKKPTFLRSTALICWAFQPKRKVLRHAAEFCLKWEFRRTRLLLPNRRKRRRRCTRQLKPEIRSVWKWWNWYFWYFKKSYILVVTLLMSVEKGVSVKKMYF